MQMFAWLNNLRRNDRGIALVEFGAIVPFFMLITVGMVEVGRAFFQANAIEKGVRAGALFAARNAFPLSSTILANAENLVKTGTADGSGDYLVSGWNVASSDVDIVVNNFDTGNAIIPVVRITAQVPFDPMLPGLHSALGIPGFIIKSIHEQAYVGD